MSRDTERFEAWARQIAVEGETPIVNAATVVLIRDANDGIETLMLRRNSKLAFGGMWVFPGGRIDDDDHHDPGPTAGVLADADALATAARRAASRESVEEAGVAVDPDDLVWFSHWIPPPVSPKRFATWFFLAAAPDTEVVIDGGEIHEHDWMTPADALRRRDLLEIELAPPTWVSLHYLRAFSTVAEALAGFAARSPRFYATHLGKVDGEMVTMWEGDAGYDSHDPTTAGLRHRITMHQNEYRFDDSGAPWT